jgi:transcription antitermination factor NusG
VLGEKQNYLSMSNIPVAQGAPWHVLHVRSNAEKRVAQYLAYREIEAYVPLFRERVKWTDRTVVVERPLFAGYVFTRFSPQAKITVISTPGVVRSLGDEEKDLVSSSELDQIQSALISGYSLRPHPHLTAGKRVRVRDGIFEGAEGVVTELRQQCKVVIALGAVQQCFSLELNLESLQVIS